MWSTSHSITPVCNWFRSVRRPSSLLLLSTTSVTLFHHKVPCDIMIIWIQKRAHTVSPWQQPNDKQLSLSLVRFPSMSEWIVKVSPWCLSVNWAYYVSASGCKGRRGGRKEGEEGGKKARKEGKTEFLSLQRRQMSQSYFHEQWPDPLTPLSRYCSQTNRAVVQNNSWCFVNFQVSIRDSLLLIIDRSV